MTSKEKFLLNIQERIKVLQSAYDYNKNLPDDIFESLNGSNIEPVSILKKVTHNEGGYGANINTLREILKNSPDGIAKADILKQFPNVDGDKYIIVTNALSSLMKGGELEKIKPKKKMRGFYWKLKDK